MTKAKELALKGDIFLFDLIIFTQEYLQTHNEDEVGLCIRASFIDEASNATRIGETEKERQLFQIGKRGYGKALHNKSCTHSHLKSVVGLQGLSRSSTRIPVVRRLLLYFVSTYREPVGFSVPEGDSARSRRHDADAHWTDLSS